MTIRREIERRTEETVSSGAVYTTLERLEGRGLVSSFFGDPTAERGGKRKKFYRLEVDGAEALNRSYEAVQHMAHDQLAKLREASGEHKG